MLGKREHVHRHGLDSFVPSLDQDSRVPGQGLWVAGDVHDGFRLQGQYGIQELHVAAGAGRVHHQHVQRETLLRHLYHETPRIVTEELRVRHPVELGVLLRIPDGVGVQLHADELLHMVRCAQADGACAAVGVQQRLLPGEAGVFDGGAVEDLRLPGVDLVEALRADAEPLAAQLVLHVPGAVEDDILCAQDHAGFLLVDVENDGGDLRVPFDQIRHEGFAAGELRRRRHQHYQDLPCYMTGTHQYMAQEAAMSILIIDAQLVAGDHPDDGLDDGVGPLILDQAALHRHHMMGAHGVHAGDRVLVPVRTDDGMHLVAVMMGIIHAQDGLDLAELPQQLFDLLLLQAQLLRVGEVTQLASAAAGRDGAMGGSRGLRPAFGMGFVESITHGEKLLVSKLQNDDSTDSVFRQCVV